MVATVGASEDYRKLLENFLLLEHDAITAYEATSERLGSSAYKEKVEEFLGDHCWHVKELDALASRQGAENPSHGDAKEYLTTGKVKIAAVLGHDHTILRAMANNENDTISAYQYAAGNFSVPAEGKLFFQKGHEDERRHKEGMDRIGGSS